MIFKNKFFLWSFFVTLSISVIASEKKGGGEHYVSQDCFLTIPDNFLSRENEEGTFYRIDSDMGIQTITYNDEEFDERIFSEPDLSLIKEFSYENFYLYHYALLINENDISSFGRDKVYFVVAVNRNVRLDFSNMAVKKVKEILSSCE